MKTSSRILLFSGIAVLVVAPTAGALASGGSAVKAASSSNVQKSGANRDLTSDVISSEATDNTHLTILTPLDQLTSDQKEARDKVLAIVGDRHPVLGTSLVSATIDDYGPLQDPDDPESAIVPLIKDRAVWAVEVGGVSMPSGGGSGKIGQKAVESSSPENVLLMFDSRTLKLLRVQSVIVVDPIAAAKLKAWEAAHPDQPTVSKK